MPSAATMKRVFSSSAMKRVFSSSETPKKHVECLSRRLQCHTCFKPSAAVPYVLEPDRGFMGNEEENLFFIEEKHQKIKS